MTHITLLFHSRRHTVEHWVPKGQALEAVRRYRSLAGMDVRVQRFSLTAVILVIEPTRPATTRAPREGGNYQQTVPLHPLAAASRCAPGEPDYPAAQGAMRAIPCLSYTNPAQSPGD